MSELPNEPLEIQPAIEADVAEVIELDEIRRAKQIEKIRRANVLHDKLGMYVALPLSVAGWTDVLVASYTNETLFMPTPVLSGLGAAAISVIAAKLTSKEQ
jgi:hypothetical protein